LGTNLWRHCRCIAFALGGAMAWLEKRGLSVRWCYLRVAFLVLAASMAQGFGISLGATTPPASQPSQQSSADKPRLHSDALDIRDYSAILKSQGIRDELKLTDAQEKQMDLEKAFLERRLDSLTGDPMYGPNPTVSLFDAVKQLLTWTGIRTRRILTLDQDDKYQSLYDDHRLSPVGISVAVSDGRDLTTLGYEVYHEIEIQWPRLNDKPTTSPSSTPPSSPSAVAAAPATAQPSLDEGDRTLRSIKRELPAGLVPTDIAGDDGGGPFVKAANDQGPVFGFHVTMHRWMRRQVIGQIAPIYQRTNPPTGTGIVYARPGYVINGVMADCSTSGINAIRVQFAKWKDGKVIASDTYNSDWIGVPTGEDQEMLGGNAAPIFGVCGRQGMNVDALGLVVAKSDANP
jgi:hypothetical protein